MGLNNLKKKVVMQRIVAAFIALPVLGFAAQGQFIFKGKITYERKTNQHALLDENNRWEEMSKKHTPKFISTHYDLYFDRARLLYRPGEQTADNQFAFGGMMNVENIISTRLDSNTQLTQKTFFGDTYLIADSLRTIDWKMGTEIRKIAGFDCRKAVGKIMDSIIVIAFYADEIVPSGGPESFLGLPGMILGIAIPKLHTTWYATSVQLDAVTPKDLADPRRGKKFNGAEFRQNLSVILNSYGGSIKRNQWQFLL